MIWASCYRFLSQVLCCSCCWGQKRKEHGAILPTHSGHSDSETYNPSTETPTTVTQPALSHVAALESALESKNETIERLTRRIEALEQDIEQAKKHVGEVIAEKDRLRGLLSEAGGDGTGNSSADKVVVLQRALRRLEKDHQNTVTLLDQTSAELDAAHAFLMKADDYSDIEVLQVLQKLNSQIFQTSASLPNPSRFAFRGAVHSELSNDDLHELERFTMLDQKLLSALRSVDHSEDPILVQTALQACMAAYAYRMVTMWCPGADEPNRLQKVYLRIKEREPQSVVARWRALCRSNLDELSEATERQPQVHAVKLSRLLAGVLIACGINTAFDPLCSSVMSGFGATLEEIAQLALELRKITGELILSRELTTVAIDSDATFDPDHMDDEWAGPNQPPSRVTENVVCTTQLGLLKEEKRSGVLHSVVLKKPKVVLRSALEQLTHELSQPTADSSGRGQNV